MGRCAGLVGTHGMAATVSEDAAMTEAAPERRSTRVRWVVRVVIGLVIAALVIGYVAYMAAGMPGMNHSAPAGLSYDGDGEPTGTLVPGTDDVGGALVVVVV